MRLRFLPATLAMFLLCVSSLSPTQAAPSPAERSPAERSPAERLEADLRALFSERGTLEIGEVSAGLIRDRVTAEDIHFTGPEGQRLWLERYVVIGDYDRPDEVRLEAPSLEIAGREPIRLSAEHVVLDAPSRAVLPLQADRWPEGVTVAGLAVDALVAEVNDRRVATLAGLEADTDMTDGEGALRLEALELDLARMIALAPAEERTRLRMASNVLTGGSGTLRLDVDSLGRWTAEEGLHRLLGETHITAAEAFGLDLEADLPVRLPEGVEPAAFLGNPANLEAVTLLGGRVELLLTERGLFTRLAPLMAAGQGISEAEFLAQARTQAEGFGMLLGPQLETLLTGLVDMMAGNASELAIHLSLPVESAVEGLAADPLALPARLSMRIEAR